MRVEDSMRSQLVELNSEVSDSDANARLGLEVDVLLAV